MAYQPPPQPPSNTTGLLAMIFGIVAVPTSCCFLGLPLGVAASVLAGVSLRKVAEGRATNRGMALTGLVCGVVGIVVTIGLITLGIITPSDPIGYTG
ncbi:MAG: DUF4190 domain-containing protein [Micromonosporaceae bacterium]|nr:DUF4190 domain-containing protein [Micromonosporaceae bacterium]